MANNYEKSLRMKMVEIATAGLKDDSSPLINGFEADSIPAPVNMVSGKAFSGVNRLILSLSGSGRDPRWITEKQRLENDCRLKEGLDDPRTLVFWIFQKKVYERDENGEPLLNAYGRKKLKTVRLSRPEMIFYQARHAGRIEKSDGRDWPPYEAPGRDFSPTDRMENFIAASGAVLKSSPALAGPRYNPSRDVVNIPPKDRFSSELDYYSAIMPALVKRALYLENRTSNIQVQSAETQHQLDLQSNLAAFFVAQDWGLQYQPVLGAPNAQSSAQAWARIMEQEPETFFQICGEAEKLKNRVLAFGRRREQELERDYRTASLKFSGSENGVLPVPETAREKVYLQVPFKEKDQARALGARWERETKSWVALPGTDLGPLAGWIPEKELVADQTLRPQDEFGKVLQDNGLLLDGPPNMDGKIHYVAVVGGEKNQGRYQAVTEKSGWGKNGLTGHQIQWHYSGHELDDSEIEARKAESRAMTRERNAGGNRSKRKKQLQKSDISFIAGTAAGPLMPVLVTSDPESARALGETTGFSMAIASEAHKLPEVARWVRENHIPEKPVIICAVDDHGYARSRDGQLIKNQSDENMGLVMAHRAAHEVDGLAVAPSFTEEEKLRGLKTFGDFYRERGPAALAEVFAPFKVQNQKQAGGRESGMSR